MASTIPTSCKVLVVGGGPGGSYAAAALAREGVDVVLLEADVFPRYHIGESMLASIRHFFRFVDLDTTFDEHGFFKKIGAAFKLNPQNKEGFTDFIAAGGPNNYAWNVVRSESDEIMFKHAGKCGAKIFDGVRVKELNFDSPSAQGVPSTEEGISNLGRPVSAMWSRKSDGTFGTIKLDYVVDASGRAGLVNTKYFKNRKYNSGLKNIANWAYWEDTGHYAPGTARANAPFFEALHDESGWAWFIPLHNGTTSVGVVMNQEIATSKKRATEPSLSLKDLYLNALELAPSLKKLIGEGKLVTDVKQASDYSYSSSSYASPHIRIVGDAGCFIDPFFSSGVHLALASGLAAATTISASLKGDCDELTAAKWHSAKVSEGYTRFLLIVLSAYKQMRNQTEAVLADFDEDNFDRAFALFRPVIQGTADISSKLSQAELSKTLEFCATAFESTLPEDRARVMEKMAAVEESVANGSNGDLNGHTNGAVNGSGRSTNGDTEAALREKFTDEELRVVKYIRARQMMRTEDTFNMSSFTTDVINGLAPRLERGNLGLDSRNA